MDNKPESGKEDDKRETRHYANVDLPDMTEPMEKVVRRRLDLSLDTVPPENKSASKGAPMLDMLKPSPPKQPAPEQPTGNKDNSSGTE